MIAIATGEIAGEKVKFSGDNAKRVKPFVKHYEDAIKKGEALSLEVTISGKATVVSSEFSGDGIEFELIWLENPTVEIEKYSGSRSMAQHKTLRGIERFIAWAMLRRRPTDREVEFVHEAVLEDAAPRIINPVNQSEMPKRSSMLSVYEMSKCIERSLVMLGQQDISDDVMMEIGGDMTRLWRAWYTWRYSEEDPLFDEEQTMDWEEYCDNHVVCELCGIGPSESDPLERQHIVSGGSDKADYEKPWNWIRAHHSHHARQHQLGWDRFISEYPHIRGKISRARQLAGKRNIEGGAT